MGKPESPSPSSSPQRPEGKAKRLTQSHGTVVHRIVESGICIDGSVHIGGFAIGVGSIALVDSRLLNLGLRDETPAQILRYTEPWTLVAMAFIVFSGFTLFVSQVHIYLINLIFPIKMYVLVAALIYNFTVHRKVATMKAAPPVLSKFVAILRVVRRKRESRAGEDSQSGATLSPDSRKTAMTQWTSECGS